MGNLFSVQQACRHVGLEPVVTSSSEEMATAQAVIIPGVGAFGEAMQILTKLDLVSPIRDFVTSGKPLIGICLGMQLLMTESSEFGHHKGLGILEGDVVRLEESAENMPRLKIPQVGWNQIHTAGTALDLTSILSEPAPESSPWQETYLEGLADGEFMYFVHSFLARPTNSKIVLSSTLYGQNSFCSSLHQDNVFACQFHPERSGPQGILIYQNLAKSVTDPSSNDS